MLQHGTKLDPSHLAVHEVGSSIPIDVTKRLGTTPYGERFLGTQDRLKLLLTAFEPEMVAAPPDRAALKKSLSDAAAARHPNLLSTYGCIEVSGTLIAVRGHPGCPTLRRFIERRQARQKNIAVKTALGIVIEVAHALCSLHTASRPHGFINSTNVFLSKNGDVLLGGLGNHVLLRHGALLKDAYASGALPMPPPELRGRAAKPSTASDIFLLSSLFVEMMTGRPISGVGDDLGGLPGEVVPALKSLMQRCIVPNADERPRDAFELLERLGAFHEGAKGAPRASRDTAPEPDAPDAPGGVPQQVAEGNSTDQWNLGSLSLLDSDGDAPGMGVGASPGMPVAAASVEAAPLLLDPVDDAASPGLDGISLESEAMGVGGLQAAELEPGPTIGLQMPDADISLVVVVNDIDEGPYDLDTIRGMIREGRITRQTMVGAPGDRPDPAGEHPATSGLFHEAASSPAASEIAGMSAEDPVVSLLPDSIRKKSGLAPVAVAAPSSGQNPGESPGEGPGEGPTPLTPDMMAPVVPPRAAPPTARRNVRRGGEKSAMGTLGWLLLLGVIFAAVVWVMWQRQGGGA